MKVKDFQPLIHGNYSQWSRISFHHSCQNAKQIFVIFFSILKKSFSGLIYKLYIESDHKIWIKQSESDHEVWMKQIGHQNCYIQLILNTGNISHNHVNWIHWQLSLVVKPNEWHFSGRSQTILFFRFWSQIYSFFSGWETKFNMFFN